MTTEPTARERMTLLLLDDNADLVELYKKRIQERTEHQVVTATDGYKARTLAERYLFDVIVIDAKLDYKGLEFGGLRLAEDLGNRYGGNSIIAISRFITSEMLRERDLQYEFLEKSPDRSGSFVNDLCDKVLRMRQQQYVFVAMPFAGEMLPVYDSCVKDAILASGYHAFAWTKCTTDTPCKP